MSYLHIKNLYKDQRILLFKEVYAMEKIHGTSAHVRYDTVNPTVTPLTFFSGGEKHERFVKLFNADELLAALLLLGHSAIAIYGDEWVTPTRLQHVLDAMVERCESLELSPKLMSALIGAMTEDVMREGAREIVDSREARAAIGRKTALVFKEYLKKECPLLFEEHLKKERLTKVEL